MIILQQFFNCNLKLKYIMTIQPDTMGSADDQQDIYDDDEKNDILSGHCSVEGRLTDGFFPGEQPIFTCKAHVFHIDPKTKRSWISASNSAVPVSFFYDSSRALYRIISVEGTKAVINSTITPNMTFTKTSQKFGQWSDVRANTVYGLGFGSEGELNKFIEKFAEVKEATSRAGGGKANGGGTGTTPTTSANASPVTGRADKHNDNVEPQHFPHQNQNDAVNSNLLKTQLNLGNDSPKKVVDKGPAPNPPLSGEAQLKYENDRLKLALAQSSANAKKWEVGIF